MTVPARLIAARAQAAQQHLAAELVAQAQVGDQLATAETLSNLVAQLVDAFDQGVSFGGQPTNHLDAINRADAAFFEQRLDELGGKPYPFGSTAKPAARAFAKGPTWIDANESIGADLVDVLDPDDTHGTPLYSGPVWKAAKLLRPGTYRAYAFLGQQTGRMGQLVVTSEGTATFTTDASMVALP